MAKIITKKIVCRKKMSKSNFITIKVRFISTKFVCNGLVVPKDILDRKVVLR